MGASYKARCIVLKKTKLGEADLILTMLSQEGKQIRGVAKGARKPGNKRFGARLEPFSVVDLILYPGKSLESITEVRCLEPNAACREDLDKAGAASVIAELLDKATKDGEVGERAFLMSCTAFQAIGLGSPRQARFFACAFICKLSAMMGLRPAVAECAYCGEPVETPHCFDITAGGVLCQQCANGAGGNVDPRLVSWIDLLLRSTFAQLAGVENPPVRELLSFDESWIREHLGITLKSMSFLRMVS